MNPGVGDIPALFDAVSKLVRPSGRATLCQEKPPSSRSKGHVLSKLSKSNRKQPSEERAVTAQCQAQLFR